MAASRPKKRARKARPETTALIDGVGSPLTRCAHLVRALEYVGYGLHGMEDDSADGILALVTALNESLKTAKAGLQRLQEAI